MLGLEKGKVKLENYDSEWKKEFDTEKVKLEELIGKYILSIEHVGSTAIPGLIAKPIIDIAIVVKELEKDNKYIGILIENGYEYRDDNGAKGEYLFKKKNAKGLTTHFLHVIEKDSERHQNYILFKEYMLKHSEEIGKYNELKKELFEKYSNDRKKYTMGKEDYIKNILEKSKKEKKWD